MRIAPAKYLIVLLAAGAGWTTPFLFSKWHLAIRSRSTPSVSLPSGAVHDADVVCPGDIIESIFSIRNTGIGPVRVSSIKTSCNCTRHRIDAMEIAPGGHATLQLTTSVDDAVSYESIVRTDADVFFDGFTEPLRVSVRGRVVPELPAVIDFGRVRQNEKKLTKRFPVYACRRPLFVADLTSDSPWLDAHVVDLSGEQGDDTIIEAIVYPTTNAGMLFGRIAITFADPSQPPASVAVRAMVAPRIEVHPPTLILGTFEEGTTRDCEFRLVSTIGEPFDVLDVSSELEGLQCRVIAANTFGTEFIGYVRYTPAIDSGKISGTMKVETTDENCPTIVIPVFGVCMAAGGMQVR